MALVAGFNLGGLHSGEQVAAQAAGVGRLGHVGGVVGVEGGIDELGLAGPATIDGGLTGVGAGGDSVHGQRLVANFGEELQGGFEDGLLTYLAARTRCLLWQYERYCTVHLNDCTTVLKLIRGNRTYSLSISAVAVRRLIERL